jgi:cellulose synthase/poly-beta-1,6-N-acetylglucosamine synthase-like glycosyltransferase
MEVSVVIPVYNAERFVAQAVESALAEPEVAEIILVEDGSTDDTLEACCALADREPRVRVFQHPQGANRGPAESRNLGISQARCEFTAFLDADDYFLPGRFCMAREIFASDPSVEGVYEAIGTTRQHERASSWYHSIGGCELTTVSEAVQPERLFEALLDGRHGYFGTDGIVVRSSLFEKTGPFNVSLRLGEDIAMWLKMAALGRLVAGCINKPVSMRRLHGGNTTYRNWEKNHAYAIQMWKHMLRWARSQGLPLERRVSLLNVLLNFRLKTRIADGPFLRRKCRDIGFLTRFAARHPLALRSPYYRSLVSATLGWRRVAGSLKRRERPQLAHVED